MKNNQELRKECKILKATGAISNYYELAELLEINPKSFYNWLSDYYTLGSEKMAKLELIISDLTLPD